MFSIHVKNHFSYKGVGHRSGACLHTSPVWVCWWSSRVFLPLCSPPAWSWASWRHSSSRLSPPVDRPEDMASIIMEASKRVSKAMISKGLCWRMTHFNTTVRVTKRSWRHLCLANDISRFFIVQSRSPAKSGVNKLWSGYTAICLLSYETSDHTWTEQMSARTSSSPVSLFMWNSSCTKMMGLSKIWSNK